MSTLEQSKTQAQTLLSSARFQEAKATLQSIWREASSKVHAVRPGVSGEAREFFLKALQDFQSDRGRELFYPYLSSGLGSGPFVELVDGSVKYDMITGIGINFFGHSHPALMDEVLNGIGANLYQGNLQPGHEARDLLAALLPRVKSNSRLRHGWLTTCGTMANEIALKIIRQKKAPATKVLAFRDCFAGRSTAMQEITDNPKYREGQPVYGEVHYLPFYDAKLGLDASIQGTLAAMKDALTRYPGMFAALMMEPIQGEGGFNFAPRDYYVRVFEEARLAGLAVWLDEIQSFGRTGELFAFQLFELGEYVDVVTAAKMLQSSVVLYSEEYNPRAGLVAGTFSGATVALRAARRTLELLDEGRFLGPSGKIKKFSDLFLQKIETLSRTTCSGMIGDYRGIGGMIAFQPFDGSLEETKAVLMKLFDLGVVAYYCGHGPLLIRLLPPIGAMTEEDVDQVCKYIEQALLACSKERK